MRLNKKAQIEANKEVLAALNCYNEEVKETILHHGTWGCKERVTYREV